MSNREASDQRQWLDELRAEQTEYERAMADAAHSVGCCKDCGRQIDFGDKCVWCEEAVQ